MPIKILNQGGNREKPAIQFYEGNKLVKEVDGWEEAFRYLCWYHNIKLEELL